MSARSAGASRSMRAIAAASMQSGSVVARRRRGAQQVAQELRVARRTAPPRARGRAAARGAPRSPPRRARAPPAGPSARGLRRARPAGVGRGEAAGRRAGWSRRATGGSASRATTARSRSADAASMWWASSTSISVGPGSTRAQEAQHDLVQAGGAELGRERGDLRRRRAVDAERDGEQRQPRHERRVALAHLGPQAREHDRRRRRPSATPSELPSSSRQTMYGAEAVYASQVACSARRPSARASRSSSSRRDLPMPGSPATSTSRPAPRARGGERARRARRSRPRARRAGSAGDAARARGVPTGAPDATRPRPAAPCPSP